MAVGVLVLWQGEEVLEKQSILGSEEEADVSWVFLTEVVEVEASGVFSAEGLLEVWMVVGVLALWKGEEVLEKQLEKQPKEEEEAEHHPETRVDGEAEVAEEELVAFHLLVYRVCCGIEANLCVIRLCYPLCFQPVAAEEAVLIASREISFASLLVVLGFAHSSETLSVD